MARRVLRAAASKCRAGMEYTEVGLNGRCENGLGQKRADGWGSKDRKQWGVLVHMYIIR